MANAIWPATVPFIQNLGGYGEPAPDAARLVTEFENGRTQARNRRTVPVRFLVGSTPFLTGAQFTLFEQFYNETLRYGILPFEAKHCRTGAVEVFHFVGAYQPRFASLSRVIVSMQLEIRP